MLTKGDIADIIYERLSGSPASARPAAGGRGQRRSFISDWELKRMYRKGDKFVRVPAGAIISPLSADWLEYNGIEVIRQ